MTNAALRTACRNRRMIVLVIPRRPRGTHVRLCGSHGPLGRVVMVRTDGRCLAEFRCGAILGALNNHRKG